MKCKCCKTEADLIDYEYIGTSLDVHWYNCSSCGSTTAVKPPDVERGDLDFESDDWAILAY